MNQDIDSVLYSIMTFNGTPIIKIIMIIIIIGRS